MRTQDSDMSFSVSCARCGLEYSGRRPFAQPRTAASPASWRCSGRDRRACSATAPARAGRAPRAQHRSTTTSTHRRLLAPLPTTISWCRSPRRCGRRRPAGRSSSRPPTRSASSTTTACWASAATAGGRSAAAAALRRRASPPASATALHLGAGARALRRDADGVDLRTDDGERAPLRRGRRRHPRRPGARAARATRRPRAPRARRVRLHAATTPCCTPTRGCCRARRRRAPPGTTGSATTAASDRDLLR